MPVTKECTDILLTSTTRTVKFYKMQLELMWQAAESTTEAKKAFKRGSEDIKGPAQIEEARPLWYNSWVILVNLLGQEEGVSLVLTGAQKEL